MKNLFLSALSLLGLSSAVFGQSTPLYLGYNYETEITIYDTATYTITGTLSLTSDAGDVSGCYGLSLEPSTGDMYILYQLDDGAENDRNIGILDLTSGAITDIGGVGNLNDIGFVNDDLYGTTGSTDGQNFYSVDKTDGSKTMLLSPSTDNEACGLIYNYFNGNVYYLDEDHFSLIDLETNTETLTPGFPSFPEEVCSFAMLSETTALVGNYSDLFLFNLETFTTTPVLSRPNNIHGMAFEEYPLVVIISGPRTYCSSDPSPLSVNVEGDTYQWYLDGEAIDGADEMTYITTESGTYTCEVDGALTNNEVTVTVIPSPEPSFTATPNPVILADDPSGTVTFENTTTIGDTYFWDFDNGFTASVENPTYSFLVAGEYDVTLTVTDSETGCSASVTITVIVSEEASLAEESKLFSIFPTPTSDFVNIAYAGSTVNLTATLMDLNGRVIATAPVVSGADNQLDLSTLESGVYIVRITDANELKGVFEVVKH